MPRDSHYAKAGKLLSNVLGADAADEREAYRQSIDEMARIVELAELYQEHVAQSEARANAGSTIAPAAASAKPRGTQARRDPQAA